MCICEFVCRCMHMYVYVCVHGMCMCILVYVCVCRYVSICTGVCVVCVFVCMCVNVHSLPTDHRASPLPQSRLPGFLCTDPHVGQEGTHLTPLFHQQLALPTADYAHSWLCRLDSVLLW